MWGPYKPTAENPILTQRHLPSNRMNPVTSTGYADLIDDADGNIWAVFLASRPYEGNRYNTGRETFLLPVTWVNDSPVILPISESVPYIVNKSNLENTERAFTGNFTFTDNFKSQTLNMHWLMIRTPRSQWYKLGKKGFELTPTAYNFYASFDGGKNWVAVVEKINGTNLSSDSASGFVGALVALYAAGK